MKLFLKAILTAIVFVSQLAIGSGNRAAVADYDIGKKVFFERVVCESCPYPELELESNFVAEIIPELQKQGVIGKILSSRERDSVMLFVNQRFNL